VAFGAAAQSSRSSAVCQDQRMCSHYQAVKERERFIRQFGVEPPLEAGKLDLWPGYLGSFIRRHPQAEVGDEAVPEREALSGLFGLVPHWSADTRITRHTFNALGTLLTVRSV
jgi:putative SOS response-associated peptidase YedK